MTTNVMTLATALGERPSAESDPACAPALWNPQDSPDEAGAVRESVELSVIVPVTERYEDPLKTYAAYKRALGATGLTFEFLYVLDGPFPDVVERLAALKDQGEPIKYIAFTKWFGEATALTVGCRLSTGRLVMTLPAYQQIDPDYLPQLVSALDDKAMVVARRDRAVDSTINRVQAGVFNLILGRMLRVRFGDLGCGVRLFRREVLDEVTIYGDQHRFLPLLAERQGFKVDEVTLPQAGSDRTTRVYSVGTYLRRLLDIFAIYFLLKFTRKPFRFFGTIGLMTSAAGVLAAAVLIFQRLFMDVALADRPAFILAMLLIVVGVQIIAVGLIGEIIIFTRAKGSHEYWIEKII